MREDFAPMAERIHPEDAAKLAGLIEESLQSGQPYAHCSSGTSIKLGVGQSHARASAGWPDYLPWLAGGSQ